jgi:hypothetical protein
MDEKPTFNIAIIYEDSAAGRRAKHFYDKVNWLPFSGGISAFAVILPKPHPCRLT